MEIGIYSSIFKLNRKVSMFPKFTKIFFFKKKVMLSHSSPLNIVITLLRDSQSPKRLTSIPVLSSVPLLSSPQLHDAVISNFHSPPKLQLRHQKMYKSKDSER